MFEYAATEASDGRREVELRVKTRERLFVRVRAVNAKWQLPVTEHIPVILDHLLAALRQEFGSPIDSYLTESENASND